VLCAAARLRSWWMTPAPHSYGRRPPSMLPWLLPAARSHGRRLLRARAAAACSALMWPPPIFALPWSPPTLLSRGHHPTSVLPWSPPTAHSHGRRLLCTPVATAHLCAPVAAACSALPWPLPSSFLMPWSRLPLSRPTSFLRPLSRPPCFLLKLPPSCLAC
jgi:hypothetical protein